MSFQIVSISLESLPGLVKKGRKGGPKAELLETLGAMNVGTAFFVNAIEGEEWDKTSRRVTSAVYAAKRDGDAKPNGKDFATRICDGTGAHVDAFRAAFGEDDKAYKATVAAAQAAHDEACKAAKRANKPEPEFTKPMRLVQGRGIMVQRVK